MTDFATLADIADGIAAAGNIGVSSDFVKTNSASNPVSGRWFSCRTMGGAPTTGATPTTWSSPDCATAGCLTPGYANNGSGTARVLYCECSTDVANQPVIFVDYVGWMGGLDGTSLASQTVNASLTTPASQGRCNADGSDVLWFLEIYSSLGASAANATFAVTYSDNSTGNVVVVLGTGNNSGGMYQIIPASGNLSIKSIQSVTLSASTGAIGNWGVVAVNRLFGFSVDEAYKTWRANWELTGLPKLGSNVYLTAIMWSTTTGEGNLRGRIVVGIK